MPTPKEVLDNPLQHRDFLQSVDFEMSSCCPYNPNELDMGVVEVFKEAFLERRGVQDGHSPEDILYHEGALLKDESNGNYVFTNAGYLFFASNPRKRFEGAFVRVLHYDVPDEDFEDHADAIFDKEFEGSLPNIIHNLQSFLKDSTFFQILDKSGYPLAAVNEALVNAIIHREYAVPTPIICTVYRDKLVVKNPGNILQHVPEKFSLENTSLDSLLRNPRIAEWMRLMKDEQGAPLVRLLREGTRRMRQEMENLGLPAPNYETTQRTTVTLYNHFEERLAPHAAYTSTSKPETPPEQGSVKKALRSIGERLAKIQ